MNVSLRMSGWQRLRFALSIELCSISCGWGMLGSDPVQDRLKPPEMTADREKLLLGHARARAMMADPELPADVKALARKARDHAELALLLDNAGMLRSRQ
jgi:hypothetical protein